MLWTGDSSLPHEYGVEALLFLHYLRSLSVLFGLSTVFITPSISCFNHFAATHPSSTDWLDMLSWSNLPTKEVKSYWLYAALLPAVVAFTLYILTQNIARATELRRQALCATDQDHHRQRFLVAVNNVPQGWGLDRVRRHYSAWKDHIEYTQPIPAYLGRRLAKLEALIRLIERRETSFIADMVRASRTVDGREFKHFLRMRLQERYASHENLNRTWREKWSVPMPLLYHHLSQLVAPAVDRSGEPGSARTPGAVLMALRDYRWARALTTVPSCRDGRHFHALLLGSSAANIIATNLRHDGSWAEWRRSLIPILTFALAMSWTFPMAAVGGLSQVSVLTQLIPEWSHRKWPNWLLGVAQGVVPSLATSVLMWLFPRLLEIIIDRAGYSTRTDVQLSTQTVYFAFLFTQLFINPSISSGLIPTFFEVLNNGVTEVPRILAQNLPLAGNYYLSYLLVQAILLVVSTLLRPLALVNLYRASRGTATPREKLTILWGILVPVKWGELYPFYSVLAVIGE